MQQQVVIAGEQVPVQMVDGAQLTARVPPDDLCRTATAEAQRGFENNAKAEG